MIIHKVTGKILSILFRFLIIIFGLIVVISRDNYFDTYWYFISIIPYSFIYLVTLFKDGLASRIRLLNDFVFIVLILYGKEIDYTTICYLLLPIINSPNYTGSKKSILLYVFFIFSLYVINDFKFRWAFVLVTIIFITINFIIDSKTKHFKRVNALNKEIEDFLERKLELRKSYKVYEGIIDRLNKINFLAIYRPDFKNIICFKINDNSIALENSSIFVWSYELDKNKLIQLANEDEKNSYNHSNIELKINKKPFNNNFLVINETQKNKYVYFFIIESNSNQLFNLYYINLLNSITARISRVIDLENSIKRENKKILKDFRNKYFQIQNAETAMHFIRNRFNTLDNFIEMSKDNLAGEMDDEDMVMYGTELSRLERNYDLLIQRVGRILDKTEKPFSATQVDTKSPNYLFSSIRDIWLDYFSDFDYELNWDITEIDKYEVSINQDGLYLLLTDWIANLSKHSNSGEKVILNEDEENLYVIFSNKYFKKDFKNISELQEDFNSKDRDRILKRTSHGVSIMKAILDEMSVKGHIEIENDLIYLVLSFRKIRYENRNI